MRKNMFTAFLVSCLVLFMLFPGMSSASNVLDDTVSVEEARKAAIF